MPPAPLFPTLRQFGARLAMLAIIATPAVAQTDTNALARPPGAPSAKARADLNTCARPAYPLQSLRDEQQGTVTLSFLIATDGTVVASKIIKSSGFPLLDVAAQEGIARCRFTPTRVNGKPEQAWMQMQYVWTLDDPTPEEAAATLARARSNAEGGDAESQYRLGELLIDPASPGHDQAEALGVLRKAADQGHLRAQLTLGMIMQAGLGGAADPAQAMAWYNKAAAQGMPEAQHALAMMLLIGMRPEDKPAARSWLQRAAEQGYAASQAQYGTLLLQENTPESIAQGVALVRKAATQNNAYGQYLLARCFSKGLGMERDDAQAAPWYEKAALGGNRQAQKTLADVYERGQGVAADAVKAARWRTIAATPPARRR